MMAIGADLAGSVIVGHDGSPQAAHALESAIRYAEALKVPLVVARAWQLGAAQGHERSDPDDLTFSRLADFVQTSLTEECLPAVRRHPDLDVEYRAELGAPSQVLGRLSESALMLVLGSRGLGGLSGLLSGSVTLRCVHQASYPVLIIRDAGSKIRVKGHADRETFARLPELGSGAIIVGHDGSPDSARALERAVELARGLAAPLVVIRCWTIDAQPHGIVGRKDEPLPIDEASEAVRRQLEKEVSAIAERFTGVEIRCYGVFGDPGETLARLSEDAELLVVGSRGRGGFRSLVVGSVAIHCVHQAGCPTLVVPHSHRVN
jgi:nucleotide-binding universal stress UspA family protein